MTGSGTGASAATPSPWEVVWVYAKPGTTPPMEALARLLAAASAEQFGGLTAIVLVTGPMNAPAFYHTTWSSGVFPTPAQMPAPAIDANTFPASSFCRIFVVNPTAPYDLPTSLWGQFDRIVYVADAVPATVPTELSAFLKQGAFSPTDPTKTYFSSFISSILLPGPPLAAPRTTGPPLRPFLRAVVRDAFAFVPQPIRQWLGIPPEGDGFRGEPLDDQVTLTPGRITAHPRSALRRDACRLRLDAATISTLWNAAVTANDPNAVPTFHTNLFQKFPAYRTTTWRWARAVTNRRLGLAINGSGATSYRIVPVLEALANAGVPVDVMGGISGGASLGAYYCRDGANGLLGYQNAGSLVSMFGLLLAGVTSQPIESGMNWAFRDTTLDDLELRFVPVTTALPPSGPPQAQAVVRATLGAAVRASGSLPVFFARTVKQQTVYTDGAMSAQIPARALCDYGADYVFAANSVPGPDTRNPLSGWPGGEFLYRFTWAGPLLDMFTSNAFLLERIGRDAALWADVFIEMTPNRATMRDIFRWDQAAHLVDRARHDPRVAAGVALCKQLWDKVRPDP